MRTFLLSFLTIFCFSLSFGEKSETRVKPKWNEPDTWNSDFLRGLETSEKCKSVTIEDVRTRMTLSEGKTIEDYASSMSTYHGYSSIPENITRKLTSAHRIYIFNYESGRDSLRGYWGFGGYLVAENECINYVVVSYYDN